MEAIKFKILIDTREQKPYRFKTIVTPPPITEITTLKTGDYSIAGLENNIVIERKSLPDLFGTLGNHRKRFIRELERMAEYQFASVMIEADWTTIIRNPPSRSRLNPKTIHASIIAWQIRYGVHFWAVPNRSFAERTTYRLLERYYRDYLKTNTAKDLVNGKKPRCDKD